MKAMWTIYMHATKNGTKQPRVNGASSRLGCIYLRNTWGRGILYWPHHQHLFEICTFLFFLTHLTYSAHSQSLVRICAMVGASQFEARSKRGCGGVEIQNKKTRQRVCPLKNPQLALQLFHQNVLFSFGLCLIESHEFWLRLCYTG
jgi:hypothetical protein